MNHMGGVEIINCVNGCIFMIVEATSSVFTYMAFLLDRCTFLEFLGPFRRYDDRIHVSSSCKVWCTIYRNPLDIHILEVLVRVCSVDVSSNSFSIQKLFHIFHKHFPFPLNFRRADPILKHSFLFLLISDFIHFYLCT